MKTQKDEIEKYLSGKYTTRARVMGGKGKMLIYGSERAWFDTEQEYEYEIMLRITDMN